jgi:cytochrome-b5 reductase
LQIIIHSFIHLKAVKLSSYIIGPEFFCTANHYSFISSGVVYDITAYVDYHPGGEEELMRGAGIDSTDLFNEVHKWVNFQNMLKEYLIGYLVQPSKVTLEVPGQTALAVPQIYPPKKSHPTSVTPSVSTKFNYNSYQTERCYTLIVYGRIATSNKVRSCFYYGTICKKSIRIFVHCLDEKFLLDLQLFADLKKFDIRNSRLKFEIVIHKEHEVMWSSEGTHSPESKKIPKIQKVWKTLKLSVCIRLL